VAVELVPVGPGIPAEVSPVLRSHEDALRALQYPQAPGPMYAVDSADLPPAASWQYHMVLVTDLDIPAHSNGTDWIRSDTGAAI
jgi:hypothetical protein